MPRVQKIEHLPPNFGAFVAEIARGMDELYGPAAAAEYGDTARARVQTTVSHPSVLALGAEEDGEIRAILMAMTHEGTGQIFFLHTVAGSENRGLEESLIREAVTTLRAGGVDGILCETVVFNPTGPLPALEELGFSVFERAIMSCALSAPDLQRSKGRLHSRPLRAADYEAAADCLVAAYRGDPGVELHKEMTSRSGALGLIHTLSTSGFGDFRADFARCIEQDGEIAAVLLGCEAATKVGFIVQVATKPDFRGHGLGKTLVRESAEAFRTAGLQRIALGVTLDNPARRLYESLGLTVARRVNAYAWRRP